MSAFAVNRPAFPVIKYADGSTTARLSAAGSRAASSLTSRSSQSHLMPLALHRSAAFRVPVTNCCIAFGSDCRIASNRRRSCRIAGTSGPYFCSHSFSSFFTQSSFVIITTSPCNTVYTGGLNVSVGRVLIIV
jgi:hypothetical protein